MPARAWRIQRTLELWIFLASPWHTLALPELAITFISERAGKKHPLLSGFFLELQLAWNEGSNYLLVKYHKSMLLFSSTYFASDFGTREIPTKVCCSQYKRDHMRDWLCELFETLVIKNPLRALISKSNI